jgi:hypothetical protein
MKTLDFTLRFVTPGFLGGDGGAADSFRIPSLRGALRFWYRAKEGDPGGEEGFQPLFDRESRIFGSSRHGQGLRLVPLQGHRVKPSKLSGSQDLRYLGYGPFAKSKSPPAIPKGSKVTLRAIGDENQISELRKCLVLLHLFGGLGGRSRRGWGSVEVVSPTDLLPEVAGLSFEEWLGEALARVWTEPGSLPRRRTALPRFSAFSSRTRIAWIRAGGKPLEELATRYMKVTKRDKTLSAEEDLRSVKPAPEEGKGPPVAAPRVALGLPWAGKDGSETMVEYTAKEGDNSIQRRASPLLFKVLRSGEDEPSGHRILALYLKSRFVRGTLEASTRGEVLPPGDDAIDSLLRDWEAVSVPQLSKEGRDSKS